MIIVTYTHRSVGHIVALLFCFFCLFCFKHYFSFFKTLGFVLNVSTLEILYDLFHKKDLLYYLTLIVKKKQQTKNPQTCKPVRGLASYPTHIHLIQSAWHFLKRGWCFFFFLYMFKPCGATSPLHPHSSQALSLLAKKRSDLKKKNPPCLQIHYTIDRYTDRYWNYFCWHI